MIADINKDTDMLSMVETDAIGEILNISMGASATAISMLLNKKVNITTPSVKIIKSTEFEYKNLEPAIGVEINYIEGLHGSNLLIMSKADVRAIVGALLGEEISSGEELDEIHISALGEVMNQMMGSGSTALATFFDKSVNISPPQIFNPSDIHKKFFPEGEEKTIVTVGFKFVVEGVLDSEFVTVLPVDFTKELVNNAMNFDTSQNEADNTNNVDDEKEYSNILKDVEEEDNPKIIGHTQISEPVNSDDLKEPVESEHDQMTAKENVMAKPNEGKNVNVKKVQFSNFDDGNIENDIPEQENLDLVMDVELDVSVEIGRTKKQVKDVLNIAKGSIIELDKQAGEPVDIIVNGQLIAKGDVVVIDDNFGVRITKVINSK